MPESKKLLLDAQEKALSLSQLRRDFLSAEDGAADEVFDGLLPANYRKVSDHHWTPAIVVKKVSELLQNVPDDKSLIDIGSGVGKFCLLLGLMSSRKIYGIEQRQGAYEISQRIRNENLLKRVHFMHGNLMDLSWEDYDIFYLYNPFQEHLLDNGWSRIDYAIEFDLQRFAQYIGEVFRQLVWASKGKILITYHGYGGPIPSSWDLVHCAQVGGGELCMWEKIR